MPADSEGNIMNRFRFLLLAAIVSTAIAPSLWIDRAAAQEVALTPLETTEVARGYRAETLKLKPVVNDKNETIGKINDFIFSKEGNVYAVLSVGDFGGIGGHLIALPFPEPETGRSLQLCCAAGGQRSHAGEATGFRQQPVSVLLYTLRP